MGCKESKFFEETHEKGNDIKIFPVLTPSGYTSNKNENSPKKAKENRQPKSLKSKQGSSNFSNHNRQQKSIKGKPQRASSRNPNLITDRRINAKYTFKAVIGKGSFSKVVRVEDISTRQPYAIKMIERSKGGETFEAELTVLRRVNHSNVIRLIEVFDSNNIIYMVMELATGGSLLDKLETYGHFSETESQCVLKMVLSGITYLHKLGITHRDLKPDNLLYYHPGKDSKLLITDFGFASTRNPDGNPYMYTVCGTPQYVAPEIVAKRPYTNAVDMWAIGVITYIVLSGMFPFDAERDSLIFKYIMSGKYNFSGTVWQSVSEEGKNFIQDLLRTDPEKRLSAEKASKHAWLLSVRGYSPSRSSTLSGYSGTSTPVRWTGSQRSSHSAVSSRSLRSEHRRVQSHHLEALRADPEFSAMLLAAIDNAFIEPEPEKLEVVKQWFRSCANRIVTAVFHSRQLPSRAVL